jgi:hypothetical protein
MISPGPTASFRHVNRWAPPSRRGWCASTTHTRPRVPPSAPSVTPLAEGGAPSAAMQGLGFPGHRLAGRAIITGPFAGAGGTAGIAQVVG